MSDDFKKVGIALTRPEGPTGRRREYGIYELREAYGMPLPPSLYVKYEGYRERGETGEVWVGLALGGPNWRPEPLRDFNANEFETVTFFEKGRIV